QDIAIEANHLSSGTQHEPQKVAQLRNRLDQLNHLFHKHHVKTIAELLAIEHDLTLQIETFENLDEEIARVSTEIRACETAMTQIAENLTKERQKTIKPFASKVNALLHELKMEHANFKISLTSHGTFLPDGKDQIEFLFAPNKGSDHFPIKQVASGGELSRLSLITKSLVAKSLSLPTLVFDEVDSGISGDIALRMGQILREMADDHQIICITHTPQVAAKATKHLKVTKQSQGQVTKTKIEVLQSEESIYEIATMLSSSPPSKSAIASATELVYS
ncbi:MAG: DNA repair protein RecN, partial [Saprospiraceae bacterium]|nr:DNA repair protein RecN [Saprospiraceae bacterium]